MPMPGNSDPREGVLGREIFVDESIYRTELGRIFARAWLFVGHESQLPNPGDFFLSRTGEDSVIVSRDLNGKVNVLLNSCRHRGMRVCRYEQGNTSNFTCPYHGWSYRSDGSLGHVPGELIGVPWQKVAYSDRLDKSQWGLIRASKIEVYKGSVWATWDDSTPGFLDYLGGMKVYFDELLDARDGGEGGSEVISGVLKWRMACNWKFCAENFAWDTYHAHTTHRSAEVAGIGPGGKGSERHGARQRSNAERFSSGLVSFPELGHAVLSGPPSVDNEAVFPEFPNNPVVAEYFKEVARKRRERKKGPLTVAPNNGTIFPNMSFHPWFPRTIVVWHPAGPQVTEAWRWFLVDKDAPTEVKDLLRHYYMRFSGPAGMVESDDMDNWTYATQACRGVIARRYPFNCAMGLGSSQPIQGLPGAVHSPAPFSEEGARAFYGRWCALMDAQRWEDLPPNIAS
jgi:phenylpropionate dioxygenase-like ring-hydroxylating dioxygenase large terminal subunit